MSKVETMSLDEKFSILRKANALEDAGDEGGADRLMRSLPLPPYLAKVYKEKLGLDFLLNMGWNLSEVEAAFGSEWLSNSHQ